MMTVDAELMKARVHCKRLKAALCGIVARVEGRFDDPALVKFGPLSTDTAADCAALARKALEKQKYTWRNFQCR